MVGQGKCQDGAWPIGVFGHRESPSLSDPEKSETKLGALFVRCSPLHMGSQRGCRGEREDRQDLPGERMRILTRGGGGQTSAKSGRWKWRGDWTWGSPAGHIRGAGVHQDPLRRSETRPPIGLLFLCLPCGFPYSSVQLSDSHKPGGSPTPIATFLELLRWDAQKSGTHHVAREGDWLCFAKC